MCSRFRSFQPHPVSRLAAVFAAVGLPLFCATASLSAADPKVEFFEKKIRPVLVQHCYECHSAEAAAKGKLKAGLAVDTRLGLLKGGESGPAVVPGKTQGSLLLDALRHDGLEMPPSRKLPEAVIADFEKWIADGLTDPREGPETKVKKGMTLEEGRRFWSLMPPSAVAVPAVRNTAWPLGDVDRFVLASLEQQGYEPLGDVAAVVLLRRLSFDLIGLPPTPEEQAAFTAAHAEQPRQAIENLVDRLLASPHFGERWGRHWLDVARYADSNGRDRNVYFYHAWRYRNYVIEAYRKDKPFDVFLREQIAGDLLPFDTPAARDAQRIATGLLALGSKAYEEQKPEIFRMDVIDEQIDVVSRAFLGLSVGCARCHDHKFDPIPTADYYALAGIFRSTQPLVGYGPKGIKSNVHTHSPPLAVGPDAETLGEAGLQYLAKLQELTLAQNTARSDRYRVVRRVADAKLQRDKPGADKEKLTADIERMEADIKEWDVKVKAAEQALQMAMDSAPPQPGWAMGARDRETPEECKIHIRGDTLSLGPVVPRGVLQVVASVPARSISSTQSGRLELADWLADPKHPLTARVYVNRLWQHLFGRGLVATPDDFGVNGSRPSHPELLDHLALRFMRDGWSTKTLLRELVLSRTYQQAGLPSDLARPSAPATERFARQLERDPDNIWLWRVSTKRLDAEALRDAMLTTANRLQTEPPRPEEEFLAQYNPYREDEYRTFKPLFLPADIEHNRRSVYLPIIRGVLPEVFQLFDFASPDRSTSQREESTVPAQSLYFMNNAWVIAQARHLTDFALETGSQTEPPREPPADATHRDSRRNDTARITTLYRRVYAREPTSIEIGRALAYLDRPEELQPDPKAKTPLTESQRLRERWVSLCQALFASAEFRFVR